MFARVTVTQGPPENAAAVIQYIQEHIIPAARREPGFKGGYWLADRPSGTGMAITLWEGAEAEQASQMMAAQARAKAVTALGGEVKSVEVYEVVAHAQPEEQRAAQARKKARRLVRPKNRRAAQRSRQRKR